MFYEKNNQNLIILLSGGKNHVFSGFLCGKKCFLDSLWRVKRIVQVSMRFSIQPATSVNTMQFGVSSRTGLPFITIRFFS